MRMLIEKAEVWVKSHVSVRSRLYFYFPFSDKTSIKPSLGLEAQRDFFLSHFFFFNYSKGPPVSTYDYFFASYNPIDAKCIGEADEGCLEGWRPHCWRRENQSSARSSFHWVSKTLHLKIIFWKTAIFPLGLINSSSEEKKFQKTIIFWYWVS